MPLSSASLLLLQWWRKGDRRILEDSPCLTQDEQCLMSPKTWAEDSRTIPTALSLFSILERFVISCSCFEFFLTPADIWESSSSPKYT